MADEAPITTPVEPVTPAPAPEVPVTESIVVTPTPTSETPAPAPVETASPEAPEAPKVEPTVLGDALKESAPVEVTETPKEAQTPEATVTEGGQSDETAPPPKYDSWTLPEGVTLDEAKIGEFTSILSLLETEGKADHTVLQREGQKLVDFHLNEVKRVQEDTVTGLTKIYQDAWDKQKNDWKEAFLNDPEIGGNRFQTTIDSASTFIRTHGGTPEQQKEFRQLMDTSGLGNHPAMIRMLAAAGKAMSEGRPVAATKPVSQPKSKTQTMYGKS